ncbi:MAG TPA: hypothetical protein VIE66_04780 [Methylocella sp.]|jgi:hypothetical protein
MTDTETLCAAERLSSDLFTRSLHAWSAVVSFRWIGQLGLPHARNQATEQLAQGLQNISSSLPKNAKEASIVENTIKWMTKLFTGDCPKPADPGFVAKALIDHSATTFESALDAATLIFAHSVLDSAALDWCRVCALAEPDNFLPLIDQKKVTLAKVQEAASFSELRATAINGYLDSLDRAPLLKKLDLIFSLCRPSPTFVGIDENYRYDRERIVALDNLRHAYVHHGGLGVRLPQGDADLSFLHETDMFLACLVCQRYQLKPTPKPMIDFLMGVLAPELQDQGTGCGNPAQPTPGV